MNLYVHTHMFWYNINCVFKFARNACNRVHCTRTGEHGSPLHYFGNCISFIQFIFIMNFLPLLSGRIISAPTFICTNGCYTTLGHNKFFTLQTVFPTLIFHFQFSILHLIKTIYTNWERRLAVRAPNERPYRIVWTITMLRSTIIFHFQFSILI